MENKEKIEDILRSLDGIQRAEPGPFLYNKILHKISEKAEEYTPKKLVWLAAASFAILLLINWQTLRKSTSSQSKTNSIEILANDYQLLNTNTFNYN